MVDLSTTYMGMTLAHPLVPSSSPYSHSLDDIKRLEDAGAPALVMYSLFEEQITQESRQLDHHLDYFTDAWPESLSYFPDLETYNVGPESYLDLIRRAKETVDIPVIGSLNGTTIGGWTEYAHKIQQAGADALELNVYYIPTDTRMSGVAVEEQVIEILREVKARVSIPIAMKLSPYFSSFANMADQLATAGASALVLFNRFYQPDIDIESLEVVPALKLSSAVEMRLPLRWVAILFGRVAADLAITSGVQSHVEVIKGMMAGAQVTMIASELLRFGPERIGQIIADVRNWLVEHEYESLKQLHGSMSQMHVSDPAAFERANYMKVLASWTSDSAARGWRGT